MKRCAICDVEFDDTHSICPTCGKAVFASQRGRVRTQHPSEIELIKSLAPDLDPSTPFFDRLRNLVRDRLKCGYDHEMTRAVFDVLREEARYQRITPEPVIRPQQRESPGRIPKYKWGTKDNLLGKHSRLFEDEKLMALISVDFDRISAELIRELTRHPGGLYSLTSRQFEELIAEILNRHGWETALTGRGPDNGVDIVAIRLDRFTRRKLIVQCKRYSPHNKVGLSIVKELFATSVDQDGSHALLATTSWFTAPARNFELRHEFRLQLQDFNGIVQWLNDFDG